MPAKERGIQASPSFVGIGRRHLNVRNATEGPQDDLVGCPSRLSASESVPELVHQHDEEQCQVLHYVPYDGGVPTLPVLDLKSCNNEPRPMKKEVNTGKTKLMDRSLANARHQGSLLHGAGPSDPLAPRLFDGVPRSHDARKPRHLSENAAVMTVLAHASADLAEKAPK